MAATVRGSVGVRQGASYPLRRPGQGNTRLRPRRRRSDRRGGGAVEFHRLERHHPGVSRPDGQVEGPGLPASPPTTSCGSASGPPRTPSSPPRKATLDERDSEQKSNLTAKRQLVVAAEALLPVKDPEGGATRLPTIAGRVRRDRPRATPDKPKLMRDCARSTTRSRAPSRISGASPIPSATRGAVDGCGVRGSVAALEQRLAKARANGEDTGALESDLKAQQELLAAAQRYA